jgi:hypothetical protein
MSVLAVAFASLALLWLLVLLGAPLLGSDH